MRSAKEQKCATQTRAKNQAAETALEKDQMPDLIDKHFKYCH